MTGPDRRAVVIGAGPMGLEAALAASERGWSVTVLEAGRVGESLRRWGPTRLFTPLRMNLSARALAVLGPDAPDGGALLTGPEMVAQVLEPLAQREAARRVGPRGRAGDLRRSEEPRASRPCRSSDPAGACVSAARRHRWRRGDRRSRSRPRRVGRLRSAPSSGLGGPAPGEQEAEDLILRTLGALHDSRADLSGRRVALLGDGYSAANAIVAMGQWIADGSGPARVTWFTRSRRKRPCVEVPSDPLPERIRIARGANELAGEPPPWLSMHRNAGIQRLERHEDGLRIDSGDALTDVDVLVSLTGYRPHLAMLRELAIEIAAPTEGAAGLYRAISNITDCMTVPTVRPEDLFSGEAGFYLVGHKSYGRSATTLLSTGLAHLETILDIES